MRRSSSRLTRGLSSTPRTSVKMAALAPMPSAKVSTTVTASPLVRASERAATLRSLRKDMLLLLLPGGYNRPAVQIPSSPFDEPQELSLLYDERSSAKSTPHKNACAMRTTPGKAPGKSCC